MAVSKKLAYGVIGRKAKQMQCLTNYRISTKDRHIHTQDHQDAIREEGLWLGFSETRYRFVYFVRVVYLDYNKYWLYEN